MVLEVHDITADATWQDDPIDFRCIYRAKRGQLTSADIEWREVSENGICVYYSVTYGERSVQSADEHSYRFGDAVAHIYEAKSINVVYDTPDKSSHSVSSQELPLGEVPPFDQSARPISELFEEIMRDVPEEEIDKLPTDAAENHDHYIYGSPKKKK